MKRKVWLSLFAGLLTATALGGNVIGGFGVASASTTGGTYFPLSPIRILDTRITHQTLGPSGTLTLQVAGVNGVPANATAVAVNVTVTNTTAPSYLSVYPAGEATPNVSNLNWDGGGTTIANLAVVPVGASGSITFFNDQGNVDVVVDLQGYFSSGTTGSYYVPLTPARITDTRANSGEPNAGKTLGPGSTLNIQVAGMGGIPSSGVTAAVLNVTVTDTTAPSYLSIYPAGEGFPGTSTLNWLPGVTIANRVIVPLGTNGQIVAENCQGNVDVVVDVSGYFTANAASSTASSEFYPVSPTRILDTRVDGGTLSGATSIGLQVAGIGPVSGQATAVMANLTTTDTTAPSYFNVTPTQTPPTTSDLNWSTGVTVANLNLDTLGSNGQIFIYNDQGSADAIVDVFGYFQPVAASPTTPYPTCSAVSLSAPSSVSVGSALAVSASTSCASGTPTYSFWYRSTSSVDWTLAAAQAGSSYSYNTSSWSGGNYQVMVSVTTQPGVYQQNQATDNLTVVIPPCSSVNATDSPNPGVVSDPVQITATSTCPGSSAVYYVYWERNDGTTSSWTDMTGWTASSSYLVDTEGWSAGNYSFLVWVSNTPGGSPQAQVTVNDTLNSSGGFLVSNVTYSSQAYSMNCEETSLQMALTHEGITIAGNNINTQNDILNAEGVDTGVPGIGPSYPSGNPMSNFIGPPNGGESSSYEPGAYYGAIVKAAQHFGGQVLAAGEGISPTQVYRYVEENHPVVVWVTFDFQHYNPSWYRDYAGQSIPWAGPHEHSVLVLGVGVNSVLIDNPWPNSNFGSEYWGQNRWVPMSTFEAAYSTYNDMAVVLN